LRAAAQAEWTIKKVASPQGLDFDQGMAENSPLLLRIGPA
jgi:hypothetical protein